LKNQEKDKGVPIAIKSVKGEPFYYEESGQGGGKGSYRREKLTDKVVGEGKI